MTLLSLGNTGLSGDLSGVCHLTHILEIDFGQNSLHGTIPECIPQTIENLVLYSNMLTGSLPSSMSSMAHLSELLLFGNYLTGDLSNTTLIPTITVLMLQDNQFYGTLDTLLNGFIGIYDLTHLDLSHNYFSGAIPAHIGEIPWLLNLILDVNCFIGSIPSSICQLPLVKFISLNGLSSACSTHYPMVFSYLVKSYFSHYIDQGIPPCLFQLSLLQSLQLSGNGLSGTIPDVAMGGYFTSLDLSNNRLSQTIPSSIQTHPFHTLDLSYNHLNGTLTGFDQNAHYTALAANDSLGDYSVYLQSNRLSGIIPDNLVALGTISLLLDNIFDCNNRFPVQDPDYSGYSCGSSSLNFALSAFYGFSGGTLLLIIVCVLLYRYSDYWSWLSDTMRWVGIYQANLIRWYQLSSEMISSLAVTHSETAIYLWWLRKLRYISVVSTGVIVIIGYIMYPLLKANYHTVTYQYGWTYSSMFMTGYTPAGLVFFLYAITIAVLSRMVMYYRVQSKNLSHDVDTENIRYHPDYMRLKVDSIVSQKKLTEVLHRSHHFSVKALREYMLYSVALLFNLLIVSLVNVSYALIFIKSRDPLVINAARVVLALFQVLWGYILIPTAFQWITDEAIYRPLRFCNYMSVVYFINSIVIPCAVSMITLDACFSSIFLGFNTITADYTWLSFSFIIIRGFTKSYVYSSTEASTFEPPFMYSEECSSGILLAYIPVYILTYTIQVVFVPGVYFFLSSLKLEYFPKLLHPILPNEIWPALSRCRSGFPIKTGNKIAMIMVDFGVLITFGCLNPLLAIVVCIGIVSKSLAKEMIIARYIDYWKQSTVSQTITVSNPVNQRIAFAVMFHDTDAAVIAQEIQLGMLSSADGSVILSRFTSTTSPIHVSSSTSDRESNINATIVLHFTPLEGLEKSCRGMWRAPSSSLWLIIAQSVSLYILLLLDLIGTSNIGSPASLSMILLLTMGTPLLLYFTSYIGLDYNHSSNNSNTKEEVSCDNGADVGNNEDSANIGISMFDLSGPSYDD